MTFLLGTRSAGPLISDLHSLEPWENKCPLFTVPSPWGFDIAAWFRTISNYKSLFALFWIQRDMFLSSFYKIVKKKKTQPSMISKQRSFSNGICKCHLFSFIIAVVWPFSGKRALKFYYNLFIMIDNCNSVLISTVSHDKEELLPGLSGKRFFPRIPINKIYCLF